MTTSLHDRLADLATDAPPGGPAPDLWARGRRYHRRRRAGTALIAGLAVVLLGVLGTTSWQRSSGEPVPAGPTDGLRLPDRFYDPSGHLPGTDDEGPIGPLVAVVGGERADWRGRDTMAIAGVSGTTGEYRYLDIPDRMTPESPVQSADGRWLAYWYGVGERVEGVAVYDTVSGEVDRLAISSDLGLMPDRLLWVGDELWFQIWRYDANGHSTSASGTYVRWEPATGKHREVKRTSAADSMLAGEVAGGALVSGAGHRLRVWDVPPAGVGHDLRTDVKVQEGALMSPDQGRIAAIADPNRPGFSTDEAGQLLVLTVADAGHLASTLVPRQKANELLGWRDRTHVVVVDYDHPGFWSVDVETGERERLTSPAPSGWDPGTLVARDAWAAPRYHAPEPAHPLPPLLVGGLTTGIVLAGLGGLVWWRRRVRP
jgi:hypothetical protein